MGLQSPIFRGVRALEACLLYHSAHIVQGAVGDHVSKIHTALFILDKVSVSAKELATKRYGPSTAAAVLAYKRKRKIINWSYQTQADNIVGKMTIAAMDKELIMRIALDVALDTAGRWAERGLPREYRRLVAMTMRPRV
jgi:hypothetical protein